MIDIELLHPALKAVELSRAASHLWWRQAGQDLGPAAQLESIDPEWLRLNLSWSRQSPE